jgi:hypothetical protein
MVSNEEDGFISKWETALGKNREFKSYRLRGKEPKTVRSMSFSSVPPEQISALPCFIGCNANPRSQSVILAPSRT